MPPLSREVEAYINRPPRRWWSRLFGFCTFLFCVAAIVGLGLYVYYERLALEEDIGKVGELPERSIVFDRYGKEIGRLHGANRIVVPISRVSPFFQDALLAREDSRFYDHGGIDYFGVGRAVVRNVKDMEFVQGASTLTMQLARVSFDMQDKTLHRKLLEAMLARRIEEHYDKQEILAHYVNRIYFGTGLYGIERAAQAHFGKPAAELNLSEAAMLAGLIRAPNRFSPFRHYDDAIGERDTVLDRMLECGFITEAEAAQAKAEVIAIRDPDEQKSFQNSYALDLVRRDLDLILEQAETEDGGLLIYTTLDLELQHGAEAALEGKLHEIETQPGFAHPTRADFLENRTPGETPGYLQGAVIAIDNRTGGIRAVVGGRDFNESQYNRATMSRRQIGSLFKPFVYAAAYQNGLLPGTMIDDNPIRKGEIPWTPGHWKPNNSDLEFRGLQKAEYGLIKSRNTMTVRVGERAGIDTVLALARRAGIEEPTEKSAQIYIGNLGADLKTVTSAFSAFARDGYRGEPFVIAAIQNRRGDVCYSNTPDGAQLISPAAAWLTNDTLQKVVQPEGTAFRARSMGLQGAVAGKTGTTDDYRDAWFVGYNDKLTCGVWVGLDTPQTIQDRGYGGALALPIWTEILMHAQKSGYKSEAFQSDVPLATVDLCHSSGGLANHACGQVGMLYRTRIPYEFVPRQDCGEHGWRLGQQEARERDREGSGIFRKLRSWFR